MSSIAKYITTKPRRVILTWVLLILCFGYFRVMINDVIVPQEYQNSEDIESQKGITLLEDQFEFNFEAAAHSVVFNAEINSGFTMNDPRIDDLTDGIAKGINETLGKYYNYPMYPANSSIPAMAEAMISEDQTTLLMQISSDDRAEKVAADEDVVIIREVIQKHMKNLTDYGFSVEEAEKINIYLTGLPATFHDSLEAASESMKESEEVSIFVILLILIFVFGSALGLGIPLFALLATMALSFAVLYFLGLFEILAISDVIPNIMNMILIGIVVDYNLLSIVRFREEFNKREKEALDKKQEWTKEIAQKASIKSAAITIDTAGKAVVFSGFTVAIGFGSLLVLGNGMSTGMAVAIIIGVFFSILSATTLTPAILAIYGRFINSPKVLSNGINKLKSLGNSSKSEDASIWARWTKFVVKYPLVFIIIGLIIMGPFIAMTLNMQLGMDSVKMLPQGTEARDGFSLIEEKFNLGDISPIYIVIDTGVANGVFDEGLIDTIADFTKWVKDYGDFDENGTDYFKTITSYSVETNLSLERDEQFITYDKNEIDAYLDTNNSDHYYYVGRFLNQYVNYNTGNKDNSTAIIKLTSNISPGSYDAWVQIDDIRKGLDEYFTGLLIDGDEVEVIVTGQSAIMKDSSDDLYNDLPKLAIVAILLIFIVLVVLTRSILIPIEAIITISSSILFSMGIMVYVFQDGNFVELINGEQMAISFFIPLFLFTTILGLGMDYSIFLISRIEEEYNTRMKNKVNGDINEQAIIMGVTKTAGVITSAGSIMIATFLVFTFSDIIILKMMGLALAVAIFVDVIFVRTVILPAAIKLGGKYNWWLPKWLDKILPRIDIEH
ncbi:MAG: MMPL family transporter [Candidatus Kariarchaeaceae archaeon]